MSPLDPALLDEIVRRVRDAVQPAKIVLFGSAARSDMGPDSDVDLLVIVDRPDRHGRLTAEIYRRLYGIRTPVDVLVISQEEAERYAHSPALVIGPALSEGTVIYDRQRTRAA